MKIIKCAICGKDFAPLVGNQIKCPLCKDKKVRKSQVRRIDCIVCGKTFSSAIYNKKFCGKRCREAYHYTPVPVSKQCLACGKSFMTPKGNRKYCSDYCSLLAKTGKLAYLKEGQYGQEEGSGNDGVGLPADVDTRDDGERYGDTDDSLNDL